jgi:hypothetical protein
MKGEITGGLTCMKQFVLFALALLLFVGLSFAQTAPEMPDVLYITRYQLATDRAHVYGLFDLGEKPSVRIVYPSARGGKLRLQLHGRHYTAPAAKPFAMYAGFEDVTGRVFYRTARIAFSPPVQNIAPQWFFGLEQVVGLYGSQIVEIPVPPGTTVINLMGDEDQSAVSPNQLLGYISRLQIHEGS